MLRYCQIKNKSTTNHEKEKGNMKQQRAKSGKGTSKSSEQQDMNYKGTQGKDQSPRKMNKTCQSSFCRTSKLRECQSVSHEERLAIFEYFWLELKTWQVRKLYVSILVHTSDVKQKKSAGASRRYVSCHVTFHIIRRHTRYARRCLHQLSDSPSGQWCTGWTVLVTSQLWQKIRVC